MNRNTRAIRILCLALCMLLTLGMFTSSATAQAEPLSADVVVVGGGLAGLTAAISACEQGASVILVEKLSFVGGSSGYSGGGIGAVGTSVQAQYGIEDSVDSWRALWVERQSKSINGSEMYPDMDRVDWLIGQGPALIDWIISQGVPYIRPEGYGVDTVERLHYVNKKGEAEGVKGAGMELISYMDEAARGKGVQILLETKAVELVKSEGAITGVVVEDKNGQQTIMAKAVVLAAGGFAQSPELLKRFIPALPEVTSMASPANNGDGILMAEQVGAALYEDPWVIGLYTGVTPRSPLSNLCFTAELYVDANGNRVMNEAQHYALITNAAISAGGTLYMILDSSNPDIATLVEENLGENAFKGETYEDLAAAAGIDAAAFTEQMAEYNGFAQSGEDTDFGKAPQLLNEVATAPFYAIKVVPNIMGTIGGVKIELGGEVLDTQGDPIPGLYAAGENANHAFLNQVYMSGGALAIAATTGKTAGASAAAFAK